MTSVKLYCFTRCEYGRLLKEKAPTVNRGFWERLNDDVLVTSTIIVRHTKKSNAFMGCYV
jgi:hypothetical protein